jgi:hypothetical protein
MALGMARETGLEPATSGVTGRRSNQLSYSRFAVSGGLERIGLCVKPETARKEALLFMNKNWRERPARSKKTFDSGGHGRWR